MRIKGKMREVKISSPFHVRKFINQSVNLRNTGMRFELANSSLNNDFVKQHAVNPGIHATYIVRTGRLNGRENLYSSLNKNNRLETMRKIRNLHNTRHNKNLLEEKNSSPEEVKNKIKYNIDELPPKLFALLRTWLGLYDFKSIILFEAPNIEGIDYSDSFNFYVELGTDVDSVEAFVKLCKINNLARFDEPFDILFDTDDISDSLRHKIIERGVELDVIY